MLSPSTVCVRCQSRLLQRSLESSTRRARHFVSVRDNDIPSEIEQDQANITSPGQTEPRQNRKPQWARTQPEKRHTANVADSMKDLLDGLFDSNRHEAAKSPAYRYSRRLIEQSQTSSTAKGDRSLHGSSVSKPSTSYAGSSIRAGYKNIKIGNDGLGDTLHSSYTDKTGPVSSKSQVNSAEKDETIDESTKISPRRNASVHESTISKPGSAVTTEIDSNLDAMFSQRTPDSQDIDFKADSHIPSGSYESAARSDPASGGPRVTEKVKPQSSQTKNASKNVERLRTHILQGDTRTISELWRQFQKRDLRSQFKTTDMAALFADFLWAFAKLRKMEPLMDVWSSMDKHGISPAVRHWNAVLRVLQRNRDIQRFEAIWQAMLDGGTKPDQESWTIHIELLLAQFCHDWRAAMRLLDTMGKFWREAQAEKATSNVPLQRLPSIEPINAAITGLLRLHLTDAANDVVKWAQSFGVHLDTASYHIFLRYACDNGDSVMVSSILQEMERNGIKQDTVTKTILLDSILRGTESDFYTLSLPEQEHLVIGKLNQMTAEGTPPNEQTFAVALHALLQHPTPNLRAAQAVFQMSRQTGHKVSPQIYTIFLMHHFNSSTPDLDAVQSTWTTIKKSGTKIDHVLYDRMIEGYASVGELDKMLVLFKEMAAAGQSAGWLALKQALAALVRAEAWSRCAEFIAEVTSEDGRLHVGKRGWKGEREFWQLVADLEEQRLIPARRGV